MKKLLILTLICTISIVSYSQDVKKVLLIGIDGVRPDALMAANTPNLDNLIANGFYDSYALNDDITISGPGWSAILCGLWSPKHLVTGNDFTINNYEEYPSLFKRVEEENPDYHTVSICHWNPINDEIVQDDADFKLNVSSDAELAVQASDYLAVNDPDLMFLHFDEVDGAGHGFGFSPDVPEYINAIENVDNFLSPIFEALENRSTYDSEDWLIIVTTDHGGEGFSHGGTSLENENVFVIASGKNIPVERLTRDSMIISDDALNCLGDTIELQFDGDNDFVQIPDLDLFDFGSDRDFTIECRIRTDVPGDYAIIGNKDWNSGLNTGFVFSFKFPVGPEWKINISDNNSRVDINTGGEIADNEWHTLSASFDRDGLLKMYQDGVFLSEADISNIEDISTGQGLFFGTDFNQNFDFPGSISEVRVWEGIVTENAISNWQCTSIDNMHPNYDQLIGHWKLNEGDNLISAIDYSPEQNNGSIVGAEWYTQDSIVVYSYENTSRLVDIPPTVFKHLCIDIDAGWELDGNTLIDDCMISGIDDLETSMDILIYPNPARDYLNIKANKKIQDIHLIDLYGKPIINKKGLNQSDYRLHIEDLHKGIYFIRLKANVNTNSQKWIYKKIIIAP